LVERWQAFWRRESVKRPLIGVALEAVDLSAALGGAEGRISPAVLDIEAYLEMCDRVWKEAREMGGDAVWAAAAFQGLPWMEAICGCRVFGAGGSLWAEPVKGAPEAHLATWQENPWYALLLEVTRALAVHAGGRYPVALPVQRGPADILSAMRGSSAFCLDFYDAPERLQAWLSSCNTVYLEVVRETLTVLSSFGQGSVQASRQVWAPGLCLETQQDAAALISPDHYRAFILPLDRQGWGLAPYAFRHLHSTALHYLDNLLLEPELRAVEITLDDGGPPLALVAERVAEVQWAGKPVILHGTLSPDEIVRLAHDLSPIGLYIATRASSAAEATRLLKSVAAKLRDWELNQMDG
jgi:hypothetical protein